MAIANFAKIGRVPELRRKVLFTLGMLVVYRLGAFVSVPGINRRAMAAAVSSQGGLLGMFNAFTGGALAKMSIFSLGIMPYVSASIIMQLMGMVYAPIEELRKDGEQGRRKIDQYTRYGTILISLVQGMALAKNFEAKVTQFGPVVAYPGWGFKAMTLLTLTTGTALLMWIGEQITERGVSNGISMLIFGGIVTGIPRAVGNYFAQNAGSIQPLTLAGVVCVVLASIGFIVFFERAQRRIPIVYSRRQVRRRVYGQASPYLPLKVNSAGVIPPIFASSLLMFPQTLANLNVPGMRQVVGFINRGDWIFYTGYTLLIIFFCFFYTAVTYRPEDVADNLKKQQANIPGIRPGRQTAEYLDRVLSRITVGGALYIAAVCVIPQIVIRMLRVPFRLGGTSIIIVVGVALETMNQIETHLISHNYEGFAGPGGPRIRGRRDLA